MKLKNTVAVILCITYTLSAFSQTWRSSLYPENWIPGYTDSKGRFLHDFSFAGYHSGMVEIPQIKGNKVDVTKAPYFADKNGIEDATEAIQKAIDATGEKGGGIVYLPAGEYKIRVPENRKYGLIIKYDHVILRGEGVTKTFIKSVTTNLRNKVVLSICRESGNWGKMSGKPVAIATDLYNPTTSIPLMDVSQFNVGDKVLVTSDATDAFAAEHGCLNYWKGLRGPSFAREIIGIDTEKKCITIDAPTRYFLKVRDVARVYKLNPQLVESGIENLSIGNIQNNNTGWRDLDFDTPGTAAYEVHNSVLMEVKYAQNCWVKNISTYKPAENTKKVDVLSNCLLLNDSRFITVENCNFQNTQYKGEGGNGYLYCLVSNDCLIKNCYAENGRHHYDFKMMESNGNVILNCRSKDPRLASDFHMMLSMANLIDGFISDGDYIDATFRPYGTTGKMHMYSTTQSVIWNTVGLKKFSDNSGILIDSRQYGLGYVIGTSGAVTNVNTTPTSGVDKDITYDTGEQDYVEGVGRGETLIPKSLYLDQLQKRKKKLLTLK